MMPSQYLQLWIRFGVNTMPLLAPVPAFEWWYDVTSGNLSDFIGFDFDDLMEVIGDTITARIRPLLPYEWETSQMWCNSFYSSTQHITTVPSGLPGAAPSGFYSPALSCCIIKKTATPGRNGTGRMMVPCVPKAWITNGVINATGLAAYRVFAAQMRATWIIHYSIWSITLRPCLHSLQDNDLKPITSFEPRQAPSYFYRRRIRS
jgi:hypothetical protein